MPSLFDPPPLHRHGSYLVQPARHEIMWPDGSTVGIHPVRELDAQGRAHDSMFLRALRTGTLHWIVIDLRDVAPQLDTEMREHFTNDVPGVVFYTLRLGFGTACQFIAAARRAIKASWYESPVCASAEAAA